jgi:hypothetical protein
MARSIQMRAVGRVLPRVLWLVWLCLLFGAQTATASGPTVVADFDGARPHDRAEPTRRVSFDHAPFTIDDESEDTATDEVPAGSSTSSLVLTRRYSPPPLLVTSRPATHIVVLSPQPELLARVGSRPPPLFQQV